MCKTLQNSVFALLVGWSELHRASEICSQILPRSVRQHELRRSQRARGRRGGPAALTVPQHRHHQTRLRRQWQGHPGKWLCLSPLAAKLLTQRNSILRAHTLSLRSSGAGNPRFTHSRQRSHRRRQPGGVCVSTGAARHHRQMSNHQGQERHGPRPLPHLLHAHGERGRQEGECVSQAQTEQARPLVEWQEVIVQKGQLASTPWPIELRCAHFFPLSS